MAQVKPCTCQPFAHTHVGRSDGSEAVRVMESAIMAATTIEYLEIATDVLPFVPEEPPAAPPRVSRASKAEPASALDDPAQKADES